MNEVLLFVKKKLEDVGQMEWNEIFRDVHHNLNISSAEMLLSFKL